MEKIVSHMHKMGEIWIDALTPRFGTVEPMADELARWRAEGTRQLCEATDSMASLAKRSVSHGAEICDAWQKAWLGPVARSRQGAGDAS